MRGGGHEGTAGLLLLPEPAAHDRERPREIADLVAGAVDGDVGRRSRLSQLEGRLAEAAQPADQPTRQRDAEDQREEQRGQSGVQERLADRRDRVADLVERFAHDERPRCT